MRGQSLKASWTVYNLTSLGLINKFKSANTEAGDFPGPISFYHSHPQRQNLGNNLGINSGIYHVLVLSTAQHECRLPLGAGISVGLRFMGRTSGLDGEKQLAQTDSQANT